MSLYGTQHLRQLRMIVTGGGTGGHTYPALTTVTTLQARLAETGATPELLWVGVADGLEATIAERHHIPFRAITTGRLRRSPNPRELARNVVDAFRIPYGVAQAALTVARTRPSVVLSTGGYVSVPIGLAARLFRVPYLLHEQTLSLGLANRILARVATRILLSHEASLKHLPAPSRRRAVVTGNPVRPAVLRGDAAKGFAAYGLDPAIPLVLVTGGATGAQQINRMLAGALPGLLPHCQIVHQCGSLNHAEMQQAARELPPQLAHRYRVVDFIHDELPDVLAAAAIVVARSGAGTVAELTALGKASVLIPYPVSAGDEQRITARHLADQGAAVMLDGDQATPEQLHAAITSLLTDPRRRAAMSQAAAAHGRPDAAARVVGEILTVASRGRGPAEPAG
ncbi:UDP-N-acetylglucosamine--N-acetylmuramyl-(pentapeptide) pyrophosphoryl-undecaprenol N-acetylglucosamine transferase [Krasilnikovia sp. MM14-A1259]|uniref:UDP-N-acetylglucosamine--N-acetylmuramyl- (pentapeptide) pyrophosphoryl-undecaprenol N-acetylglucosamine transferase n=1 Tax=Krasilnikovia sp. MM14-A1259 TaxID=3373539 RepID=UPI0037F937BF